MVRVHYANPLGLTLAHYANELDQTLKRCGADVQPLPAGMAEGLDGVRGKATMAVRGLRNARMLAKSRADVALGLWATFGLLELPLAAGRRSRAAVILHDPNPISRQVGYGAGARRLAARSVRHGRPLVVVHSAEAENDARELLPAARIVNVPHPVLSHQTRTERSGVQRVVVAGQYKPERNLPLLNSLGPLLRARGIEPVAAGRGWSGRLGEAWTVHDRFVSEEELDSLLAGAVAVVIPYHRYYQSGIAVRALELGTVPVGEENSFLQTLVGDATLPRGANADQYVQAIGCLASSSDRAADLFATFRQQVDAGWRDFLSALDVERR